MNDRAADINQDPIISIKAERSQSQTAPQNVMLVSAPTKSVAPTTATTTTVVNAAHKIPPIDLRSQYGHFGWPENTTDVYNEIPYIFRGSMKYFAVQMILAKQRLRVYLSCLHQDVYNYYFKIVKNATPAECYLLNEINLRHCDGKFGSSLFTTDSLTLILDSDAYALWEFLDTCYRKLTSCLKEAPDKIGFIQFNFSSVYIPYVVRNNERYMPLYCFSNVNNVPVEYISGWDLAYLRFCWLYQGVWRGSSEIFPVLSISSLHDHLPLDTHFLTCWPLSENHQLMRRPAPAAVGNGSGQAIGLTNENVAIVKRPTPACDIGPAIRLGGIARKRNSATMEWKQPDKVRRLNNVLQPYQPYIAATQKVIGDYFDKIR